MAKNPFLKSEAKIIKMYGNTAELHFVFRQKKYNAETGDITEEKYEEVRDISISEPAVISEAVADGKNYIIGDMTFDVSRLELEIALPGIRHASIETCGINFESDYIVIGGQKYRIVKMNPKAMWMNLPAKYRVQVRIGA
jgi:hypothetical protein